jgi:hypothetical protein
MFTPPAIAIEFSCTVLVAERHVSSSCRHPSASNASSHGQIPDLASISTGPKLLEIQDFVNFHGLMGRQRLIHGQRLRLIHHFTSGFLNRNYFLPLRIAYAFPTAEQKTASL